MDRKPSSSFEQIKPFLRMLERSIDDARHRRLGNGGDEADHRPSAGHAAPGGDVATAPAQGIGFEMGSERPQRATPIRPKTQIRPSGGSNSPGGGV